MQEQTARRTLEQECYQLRVQLAVRQELAYEPSTAHAATTVVVHASPSPADSSFRVPVRIVVRFRIANRSNI